MCFAKEEGAPGAGLLQQASGCARLPIHSLRGCLAINLPAPGDMTFTTAQRCHRCEIHFMDVYMKLAKRSISAVDG